MVALAISLTLLLIGFLVFSFVLHRQQIKKQARAQALSKYQRALAYYERLVQTSVTPLTTRVQRLIYQRELELLNNIQTYGLKDVSHHISLKEEQIAELRAQHPPLCNYAIPKGETLPESVKQSLFNIRQFLSKEIGLAAPWVHEARSERDLLDVTLLKAAYHHALTQGKRAHEQGQFGTARERFEAQWAQLNRHPHLIEHFDHELKELKQQLKQLKEDMLGKHEDPLHRLASITNTTYHEGESSGLERVTDTQKQRWA